MIDDVNCPYCGASQEINHDDGYGYEEDETYFQQCSECGKNFTYTTSISFFYNVDKASCLNDGHHNFKKTWTIPREFTMMECQTCGKKRNPTTEEMKEIMSL